MENNETFPFWQEYHQHTNNYRKNKKVIVNDFELYEVFGNFFEKAMQPLNVKPNGVFLNDVTDTNDTVKISIKILKIIQISVLLRN